MSYDDNIMPHPDIKMSFLDKKRHRVMLHCHIPHYDIIIPHYDNNYYNVIA